MPKKVRTQLLLTPEQHKKLSGEAQMLGISISELLRRILDGYYAKK